ncbi:MAG TPA: ABC transporter permease [Thermoanaerobaculia bacterium]|nr:ABC transporter permease [Thermoanaerobaculia bacterium]HQR66323.1 ABC transporter permease [Thermoanaerobaculia bacterium]
METLVEVVRQLLRDVRNQKLRTFLTVFGLVWGTVAVTLLLAFGTGLKKQLVKSTAGLGDRICIAWPGLTSIPYEGLGKGRRIRLTEDDVEFVRARAEGIRGISTEYSQTVKLHYGLKTWPVDVSGVGIDFGWMRNLIPAEGGRFLNPIDMGGERRVVFLGDKLAKNVFGDEPAVGKTVQMWGSPFLVVGVLRPKEQDSSYSGRDNDKATIPGTTFRALTGDKYVDNFIYQPDPAVGSKKVNENVLAALGKRMKFDPKDKEALMVWDTTEQFAFFDTFMLAFNLFLGIVGSLTLVVGGIGVSNIMNVVVDERTKEIGIKMALGARQSFVLRQFLLETLVLTAAGGAIGLAVSLAICAAFPKANLTQYVGIPEVSLPVAAVTTAILGTVGFLAGWFPARAASRLDPVVAMKM